MPVPQMTAEELAERLRAEPLARPLLLDVRSASEHELARLPGSILIPLSEFESRVDELDELKDKEVVVYCHHGIRSQNATVFLQARGIKAVSLAGGIDRWSLTVDPGVPRY